MVPSRYFYSGCLLLLAVVIEIVQPTCVLDSDFGFKINCAFKKSGLFRVRNLGGIKAHASLGFSLGDELGFEQSLTNLDTSRRRSVSLRNGVPPIVVGDSTVRPAGKQEKRGKQNRIMMRPMAPATRPNQAAMDKLSSLHRRVSSTMQPIVVGPTIEAPNTRQSPGVTLAKPVPMGVPPFKPLPPKEDTLKVVPISSTRKSYTPLQIPQSKGPGLAYQSENYPQTLASHNQVSKMVSQMTAVQYAQPQILKITPAPILVNTPKLYSMPTTVNPFIPMPVAAPPTQAISIIPAPVFDFSHTLPSNTPIYQTSIQNNPISNFVDPVPKQVHELASQFSAYNTKKIDDYNTISGYGDDTTLTFNKEDINAKISEIAKAGNISMEAVEAAIALRQQQLLNKYANFPVPTSTTTTTTTTTTELPVVFHPEPEPEIVVASVVQKPKRISPTAGKVMNAPREYYPVGYEKNFDDHFQSKVDLPETTFHCGDQKYFPGLYGDESLGCMVFHVCALTDDGLVMKSFLCPESTLFDQTILKCNWWFYVDCKNTRRLYDTNIPVSKSYQLMKALTFFSSYKKEVQEDGQPANPVEEDGIKEAISILENQNSANSVQQTGTNGIEIITPQPFIVDERSNKGSVSTDQTPVYRGNRNVDISNKTSNINRSSSKPKTQDYQSNSEYKLVTVNADINFNKSKEVSSAEDTSRTNTAERKHRRRMTLKNSSGPTVRPTTPVPSTTTVTLSTTTTPNPVETTTSSVEIIKQEIQPIEHFIASDVKQEKLTDQLDPSYLYEAQNSRPVKRFYRSSAEKNSKEEKEMAIINNEKVQIVRPTSYVKLVGEYPTPTAAIAKLDEAILGKPTRFKKSAITIVTPEIHKEPRRNPTNDQT
ncbi:uncharacterized protein LOC113520300 isoform X1 [Galleria mellonella]|uniref:Uncharacterized protein LOC113520300 isoform X1 n=1 Tax=Galleria mellonella TaxID=7137 RepID=A0A6J1X5C0_GALME|nr:uncharacterized protein LOC113520300 isoform X1 [Galleria mellonella]